MGGRNIPRRLIAEELLLEGEVALLKRRVKVLEVFLLLSEQRQNQLLLLRRRLELGWPVHMNEN